MVVSSYSSLKSDLVDLIQVKIKIEANIVVVHVDLTHPTGLYSPVTQRAVDAIMAKLLIDGRIGVVGSELITPFDGDLKDLINSYEKNEVLLFSSKGKLIEKPQELYPEDINKNITVIIGTFQKASFKKELNRITDNLLAISPYSLDAWVAVYKAITYYEIFHKIL